MPAIAARDRFFTQLKSSLYEGVFAELLLERYQGVDRRMRALSVRLLSLLPGKQKLSFTYIHEGHETQATHTVHEALNELQKLIGSVFLDGHLVTASETYQLIHTLKGTCTLKITPNAEMPSAPPAPETETAPGETAPPAEEPAAPVPTTWARSLDAAHKRHPSPKADPLPIAFIDEFIAWLTPLVEYAGLPRKKKSDTARDQPFTIVQSGSGRGHLAFALASAFGSQSRIRGLDPSIALVDLCNRVASTENLPQLTFANSAVSDIAALQPDLFIALHANDTATDDALAQGIAAGASLIVVAPCGNRELTPQLTNLPVWLDTAKQEPLVARHAATVTDAFRALLLSWAGYKIKTTELTASANVPGNLLIAALRPRIRTRNIPDQSVRDFARAYGIRQQRLAQRLGITL